MPSRIFIDRDRVVLAKQAHANGLDPKIPLFKIRRKTGLVRAAGFVLKDKTGNVIARGMVDPSGDVCGATAWIEVPDDVEIEFE